MKFINSSVSILHQEPGVDGLLKHIEKIGRLAYKSSDKITEDSYKKFCEMLYNRGHWAVFDSGTVYLRIPKTSPLSWVEKLLSNKWTRWCKDDRAFYVSTNLRVIFKLGLSVDDIRPFWVDPMSDSRFYRRVTSHWICSRGVSHELVRHRAYSYVMESQRYVNYSKDKYGGEITYIIPQWIYRVRDDIGNSLDSQTLITRDYILFLDGEELIQSLSCFDRTVASRLNLWRAIENEYLYETTTDEGEHLRPEEARGILCNDTKTELCMTGWLEDYIRIPEGDSKEKEGFFFLRTAKDAHPDIRVLAIDLMEQFKKEFNI